MKYMITNGNQYILTSTDSSGMISWASTDDISFASAFKLSDANSFIKDKLRGESKWGIRKVYSRCSHRNYVITTGVNYVASGGTITPDYKNVKWFKSAADADAYINNHPNLFDNAIIVDENGCTADVGERRMFTEDQLKIIGIDKTCKKTKRIVIPKTTRDIVYENGHGICAICGRPVMKNNFTIDHIIPLSRGGKNKISNYQIACSDCNRLKGGRMDNELTKSLASILYNQIQKSPNDEVSDILIRAIVRSKISSSSATNCNN